MARFNRPHQTMRLSQSIRLEPANRRTTDDADSDGGRWLTNRSDQSELAASEAILASIPFVEEGAAETRLEPLGGIEAALELGGFACGFHHDALEVGRQAVELGFVHGQDDR